jgi:hypothetical protein
LKNRPERIDLGAIYSIPLHDRNLVPEEKFFPVAREYVIGTYIS